MKASSFLQDTLFDRQLASSQEPNETAFNMAFKTKLPIFEWFEEKANEARRLRFGIAMAGAKHAASPTAILEGMSYVTPAVAAHYLGFTRIRLEVIGWEQHRGRRRRRYWRSISDIGSEL